LAEEKVDNEVSHFFEAMGAGFGLDVDEEEKSESPHIGRAPETSQHRSSESFAVPDTA
jgi:hypothetical protein